MLTAMPWKSCCINRAERKENCLYLYSERGMHRIQKKGTGILRITYTERESFSERKKPGVIKKDVLSDWDYRENSDYVEFLTPEVRIVADKSTGTFMYYDGEGTLLLRERRKESREFKFLGYYC